MRVPNAGQQLDERRIVREGKRIAEAMLASYADPPRLNIAGLAGKVHLWRRQVLGALQGLSLRS